ncbi:MAG: hypothetical protein WC260_01965 [Candidatus Pacearchaeota archaeon]
MKNKKAQQEIIGFVLIVVVVIIAALIFLVIQVNKPVKITENPLSNTLLESIMKTSSPCVITYGATETYESLINSCAKGYTCNNLGNKDSCIVLNESITKVMEDILQVDNSILAYQLDFIQNESSQITNLIESIRGGECLNGNIYGSYPYNIYLSSSNNIKITLTLCIKK